MSDAELSKLGKYIIVGTLGRGAMGTVYDARDPVIDRRVAIKTIALAAAEDAEGAEELARFRREAQAAGRLHHPNIVGVYDYGETESVAYIVMEFVDGMSLKALLDKKERFDPADTVRIMEGVLAGLQYSHTHGVVHRDIKPANIMLTGERVVKIADFGIARIESSSLTQAGTIMGTPAYMSPEQFMGLTVDLRTDIYSAGVLLYQMLTGERPFDGSMTAIMHKALNTDPPRPSDISVTAPLGLDSVVATAMAKRPEHRFASAAAFAAALRAGLEAASHLDAEATMVAAGARQVPVAAVAAPGPAGTLHPSKARSRAPLFVGIGLAGLALAGVAAFVLLRPAAPPAATASLPAPAAKVAMPPPALPAPLPQPVATQPPSAAASAGIGSAAMAPGAPAAFVPGRARELVNAALARADCTFVTAADGTNGESLLVTGIVGVDWEAGLRRAVVGATQAPIEWALTTSRGPYCKVYNLLRPFIAELEQYGQGMSLGLAGKPVRLSNNQFFVPSVSLPDFPAYLTLDYFTSDGGLQHLDQGAVAGAKAYAPHAHAVFGDAASGGARFQVAPPFGTDLIVAIASDQPLFAHVRAPSEPVRMYLPALHDALAAIAQRGGKIATSAFVVHTVP